MTIPMNIPEPLIARLATAHSAPLLTGAGVFAECGAPTFRDAQTGLWAQSTPEEPATELAARGAGGICLIAFLAILLAAMGARSATALTCPEADAYFCLIDQHTNFTTSYDLHRWFINYARLAVARFSESQGRVPTDLEFAGLVAPALRDPFCHHPCPCPCATAIPRPPPAVPRR